MTTINGVTMLLGCVGLSKITSKPLAKAKKSSYLDLIKTAFLSGG